MSNGTLEWSGGDAQPPQSSVLHLGHWVAGLGADFETSIGRIQTAPRAVWALPTGRVRLGMPVCPPPLSGPPRGTTRGGNVTGI